MFWKTRTASQEVIDWDAVTERAAQLVSKDIERERDSLRQQVKDLQEELRIAEGILSRLNIRVNVNLGPEERE